MRNLLCVLMILFVSASLTFAQTNTQTATVIGNGNENLVNQIGNDNQATIFQRANTSKATQLQNGSFNKAAIEQEGQWPLGPVVNEIAKQDQLGTNHQAYIKQVTDSGNGGSKTEQKQTGHNHYAKAWQFSWNSEIYQTQTGIAQNWAEAYQKGRYNKIEQIQDGHGNVAAVDEQSGGWGGGNTVKQEQYGRWNHTLVVQLNGNLNKANVKQTGDDNKVGSGLFGGGDFGIYQNGSLNTADVEQNFNVNWAKITQNGNSNTATVTQYGGLYA